MTDPATGEERHGGAFALLKDAQHRCELFMTAALGHWMGKLDEEILEKTLGSMSYITGTETEQSKKPTSAGCGTGRRNRLTSPRPTFADRLLQHERN